jgi:hypothetical protein
MSIEDVNVKSLTSDEIAGKKTGYTNIDIQFNYNILQSLTSGKEKGAYHDREGFDIWEGYMTVYNSGS